MANVFKPGKFYINPKDGNVFEINSSGTGYRVAKSGENIQALEFIPFIPISQTVSGSPRISAEDFNGFIREGLIIPYTPPPSSSSTATTYTTGPIALQVIPFGGNAPSQTPSPSQTPPQAPAPSTLLEPSTNPFLRIDDDSDSYVLGLTNEDLKIVSDTIQEQLNSDDPAIRAQGQAARELLRQAIKTDKERFGKCVKLQTNKGGGIIWDESPECAKYVNSVEYQTIKSLVEVPEIDLTDTCGTSTVAKIDTALLNFFNTLKEIQKYGEVYVLPAINKLQSITSLVRNTAEIIGAVLRTLVQRLRNWIIEKIRRGLNDLKDIIFPKLASLVKDTVVEQVIQGLICAFDEIINGLIDFVIDFLMALVNQIINPVFCAAEQFINAMINSLAKQIDEKLGPILDQISDVLGQGAKIVGSVLQGIDYILGFESFLCAKPNCEQIKKFRLGPDGNGPSQTQIDNWNNTLNKVPSESDIVAGADSLIGGLLGDASSVDAGPLDCNTDPYRCGPPKVVLFGGGGIGAAADAIVDTVGQVVGVNLKFGGSGYDSPPFVVFEDSCNRGRGASAYAEIENGQVTSIILVNSGGGYLNQPDGTDEFGTPEEPLVPQEQNVRDYIGCLRDFQVLNTGYGYSVNDSITLDPDIPNLQASVSITEQGQIVSITPLNLPCNITEIPTVRINSNTGAGAVIRPVIKFTAIEDFEPEKEGFDPQKLVRVIDCVSR